jgi:hypothetical protein
MKKRIIYISAIALCLFTFIFCLSGISFSAEFKFREFKSDREKFERYTDEAEKAINEQEWQDILDTGKQEMLTEWERGADSEMERYIRQGSTADEVKISMEESRAAWESDYEKAGASAKGSWYVKREKLVFEAVDFLQLRESVKKAGEESGLTDVSAWDSYVSGSLAGVNLSWDLKFLPPLADLKSKGDLLTGDGRAGFDAELAAFENELRRKFEVERNSILYTGRNLFITELYVDTESLKYRSSLESADTATENIINDVEENLKSEEEKILTKSYSGDGQSVIDFSQMGDNWEDELKQLVSTGMEKWNLALERLYRQMLSWKQDAEDAYKSAEAIWQSSAEKLSLAMLAWEQKLSKEIYEALDKWKAEESELAINIERSRQDFAGYMNNLSSQWNDHSSGLIDMAINGSMVYTESLENIKWLEKMCAGSDVSGTGAFGIKGTVRDANEDFWSIVDDTEKDRVNNLISGLPGSGSIAQRYGVSYAAHITGRMLSDECSSDEFFTTCSPVDNAVNSYKGHYYYTGGYYTSEYTGAAEKQDGNGNSILTESYTVRVYGKKMIYGTKPVSDNYYSSGIYSDYGWYESIALLDTFAITNDVTYESPDKQKSSYYYYKTELERWKKIRDSFAGIAADAESYMHEKNMLGEQDGPGYLDNDGGSDPYLMTDAEFALQVASRDRDFWQKRLDIAKAVLEYSEQAKKEGAGTTEAKKAEAKAKMDGAKVLYEVTLKEVETIVENLKFLQGKKPAEPENASSTAEWTAYFASIEYLTEKYSEANKALRIADEDYTARKRALILFENNENSSYLLKEIEEIERNILNADRELYLKQADLYKKQIDSEYSERTAGFAQNYESAVKNFEESKLRFNELKSMLAGEESDSSLVSWGNSITAGKDKIWKDNSDAYGNILLNLISDFTGASGEDRNLKKHKLSAIIKEIYFNLQENMESSNLIVMKLRDSSFDPDLFFKSQYKDDQSAYERYAERSVNALNIVDDAMDWGESNNNKNYNSILAWLRTEFENSKYIYGADNSSYIEHYTALQYFEDRYKGLTPEAWESSRDRLESDLNFSEKAQDLHNDFNTLSSAEIAELISENEAKASLGDMDAVALLREYYMTGSGIAGLEYITQFDRSADIGRSSYEILKNYVSENYRYFQKGQDLLAEHSYLDDMLGYINSIVSLIPGAGENPLSVEAFKNLSPESLSLAAGALAGYMENLELRDMPVPDFLKSAAASIAQIKENLDTGIFIWRYMRNELSDEMAGTVDDVYSRKLLEAGESGRVMQFIQDCEDVIEAGSDDYVIAMNIISIYEALSENEKKYLEEHQDEKIKGVDAFIKNLYLYRYTVNMGNLAAQYADTEVSVTPEQYALITGLTGTEKDKLIAAISPVYERRIFNRDLADGKITDKEAYIASRNLDSDGEKQLRAYVIISEYINHASGDNFTSTDPAFAAYMQSKDFKDLPDEAKIYAASKYYYDEMFSRNKVPPAGIEKFLEDRFGEDNIESFLTDAVEKYTGRLNAVSFFYGNDLEKYTKDMDASAKEYFLMYINGVSEAILPGFEYGIYRSSITTAGVLVELGKLAGELDRYTAGFNELIKQQDKYCDIAGAGLKNAEALKAFYQSGADEKNWRGNIFTITEGEVLVTVLPDTDENGWYDTFDSETGLKKSIIYSSTPVTRDGKTFSLNNIIDDMNKITSVFTALGESMKLEFKPESMPGISGFLAQADTFYNSGSSYTFDGGVFSFETGLGGVVSGYTTLSDDNISQTAALAGEIIGMGSDQDSSKNTLRSKKTSYDLLGGKTKEQLLSELEASRTAHETAKREVEKFRDELSAARKTYEAADTNYVSKMNQVSSTYESYKGFEFDYEKAYSVWEYANTPYLSGNQTDEGAIGSGQTPDGGSADYSGIAVPDARDNYARILAKFNEADAAYNLKALAVTNQDTIEKLNADAEYAKLKADFERKSQSYIRTAQVDTEVKEDLDKYKQQYEISQKIYVSAKDSVSFYMVKLNSLTDTAEKEALKELRDKILNHMLKAGNEAESKAVLDSYMSALSWYGSKLYAEARRTELEHLLDLNNEEIYGGEIAKLKDKISSNASYESAFNNLPEEMKNDIISIYTSFRTENDSLGNILSNYPRYHYWYDRYEYADHKYDHTSKWNYFKRKQWKKEKEKCKGEYINYLRQYEGAMRPVKSSLNEARESKIDFAEKSDAYEGISSVRYLEDIKAYLKQGKYNLTDEDLSHLYDSTSEGYVPDNESINLDFLRNETERKDIDGVSVYAIVKDGRIVVLDKDGKETSEVYNFTDASVKLKIEGENAESFEEGKQYEFYDRNFSISAVTGVLKGRAETIRLEYYAALMAYSNKCTAEGKHDNTVILRDMEKTYHGLQEFAAGFNLTADTDGEKRQRGLEGYGTITREYVNNGNVESIQGLIMTALMKQSSTFQEQLWTQQKEKFEERKNRWNEITGYIMNRGMKEWRENWNEFKNLWSKWRFETKKQIAEGEEWWAGVNNDVKNEMNRWTADTSKASSKEAAERIYDDLEGRISKYESDLKKKMPGNVCFDLNMDKILIQSMKNNPIDSIGILSQSMLHTDTTAGFTNILNLGLSGTLFKYNEKQMEEYTSAMGVMKNLQVIDILNGIIDGFNTQLLAANNNVYEDVEYSIRGNATFGLAPFERKKSENRWEIEVCTASNLTGDKYKTRKFSDYNSYINSTVFFQPIKGLDGTTIDFSQANTYSKLDNEDLDTYVGLETEWLNRRIEDVFKEGGTFSGHQEAEYNRLYGKFGDYYGQWMAGEALKNAGFYSKPMFPNGPNMMQTGTMIAGIAGGPWAAFAVSMLTTTMQVADGSMSWKQGAFQVGMSAATACIGVGASELSGMVGGLASTAAEAGTRTMSQIAVENVTRTVANTLVSGIQFDGEGLSWDGKRMSSGKTWLAAGVTAGVGSLTAGYNLSGFSSAVLNGVGSSLSAGITTGNWAKSFQTGAVSGIGNYIGGLVAGGISQGFGTDNAYTQALISNYATFGMRKLLGGDEKFDMGAIGNVDTVNLVVQDMYQSYKQKNPAEIKKENGDNSKTAADKFKDPFAELDLAISGVFTSLGRGLGQTMKQVGDTIADGAKWSYDGVAEAVSTGMTALGNFAERTGNLFTEGHFASDEVVAQIREQERLQKEQELIQSGVKPVDMSDAEYKQKFRETEQRAKEADKMGQGKNTNKDSKLMQEKIDNNERKEIENIKLLRQKEINGTACYFTSVIMMLEGILGHDINLTNAYDKALNANPDRPYTDDKATVKNFEGIARTQGLDVKDGTITEITDRTKMADEMIKQLDKNNPVLIQLEGKTMTGKDSSHAEVVYGYEVVDNKLRFLVKDPGGQGDTFLDANTLKPYHGQNTYSYKNPVTDRTARSVFKVRYYNIRGKK